MTIDGNITQAHEIETTNTTRTIHIPLTGISPTEHASIVITGTTAVPEFPTTAVVAASAIGLVIILSRTGILRRLCRKTKASR